MIIVNRFGDKFPDTGVMGFASWERLIEYLEPAFNIKKNEEFISVLRVTENGIQVKIQSNDE